MGRGEEEAHRSKAPMKLALRLSVRAERDVAKALYWYGINEFSRSGKFILELDRSFGILQQFPKGGILVKGKIRQVPLDRFPFVIVYAVRVKEVLVLRVFHTSRDPQKRFLQK